jgi:hypothetical protein
MVLRRYLWLLILCLPAASAHAVPTLICGDQLLQRQRERNAQLPAPKPLTRQQWLRGRRAATLSSIAGPATTPHEGDRVRFASLDFTAYDGGESSIKAYHVSATLKRVTDSAYLYVEDGVTAPKAALAQLGQAFEEKIIPQEHHYFGSPATPGIDGDPRITLLIGNVRSPASATDSLGANAVTIGGYFNDEDEYPNDDKHPYSNEREMVTLNANLGIGCPVQLEMLAHEYQHLIHWHYDRGEQLWVDEGLSMVAPALAGLDNGPQGSLGAAIMAYGLNDESSLTQWALPIIRRPSTTESADDDTASAAPGSQDEALIHYGAAGLFFLYLQEKYGGPETLGKIVRRPEHGIAGVLAGLTEAGHPVSFAGLFTQWAVANLADDPTFGEPAHYYGYRSPMVREIKASTNALHELLPDLIPRLFQPARQVSSFPAAGTGALLPQAAQYVELTGAGNLTLSFDGGGRPFEALVLTRGADGSYQLFPLPLDPQTRTGSVSIPGLGSAVGTVYLVVTNASEDGGAAAEYHYQAKLE